ncbi:MAG: magnesium/cobalt transporter CorA [Planctomycetota bacterium]|nr:magnesium/cobalt transporter CorA [Planctomycetota bacterium]
MIQAKELNEVLDDKESVVWVDIQGRTPDSDTILADHFGFHSLAIEDVYNERHRPKIEDYDDYLYIIFRGLVDEPELKEVHTIELDLFLGQNFVVTHHSEALKSISGIRASIAENKCKAMPKGAAFLAHRILDKLTDRYLPLSEQLEDEISEIERSVLAGGDELVRIVDLKGGLQRFRRLVIAQRDLAGRLARAEFDEIPAAAKPFFRDIEEHFGQLTEQLEDLRVDLSAVFDAFHSLSAHRMNEIMKVLTLISTIMLPLTFLVGVYGMNFKNMPELDWRWGYLAVWVVMIGIVVGQLTYFRKRDWL